MFASTLEVEAEVQEFASRKPHPVSCQDILNCLEPWRAAKFIHSEMPIRFAERIKWIESIRGWREIPELKQAHDIHMDAFVHLRSVERSPTLDAFTAVVRQATDNQREVVRLMATAMRRLQERDGPERYGPAFVDPFLDGFFLNRLGCNVLMSQYLALALRDGEMHTQRPTGIIDPLCDAAVVCRDAAGAVLDIMREHTGRQPTINVEACSASGDDNGSPRFCYIPGALRYMMCELLKNSCRATVEAAGASDKDLERLPIQVVVCADASNVAICLSDRAGGIPFNVGSHVWSYLYSTAGSDSGLSARKANELAGFGLGLPLSRLYARYLGGSLDLISLPGYGTHAYVFMPRLESEQLEAVPDMSLQFEYHSLGEHVL